LGLGCDNLPITGVCLITNLNFSFKSELATPPVYIA